MSSVFTVPRSSMTVQGVCRAVIILPEVSFNSGWKVLALKIERFINREPPATQRQPTVVTVVNLSYRGAFRSDKWEAKGASKSSSENRSTVQRIVMNGSVIGDEDVLSRCLIGSFAISKELPTLSDIRRWASNKWNAIPRVQMYELHGPKFLFEFPSRKLAEHTGNGVGEII